ncbi:hypothetical protein CHS0354_030719 [Potamilus streckersoni]|uniref:Kinesin motor domain-containing protein n=1 Tax=Potamilus streckersoni TaxID=2493646 RepID=A0AAE0VXZ5_9BIVA|nr:hypothetical protein CHS0354_030719 [Potamilus streckersoni]
MSTKQQGKNVFTGDISGTRFHGPPKQAAVTQSRRHLKQTETVIREQIYPPTARSKQISDQSAGKIVYHTPRNILSDKNPQLKREGNNAALIGKSNIVISQQQPSQWLNEPGPGVYRGTYIPKKLIDSSSSVITQPNKPKPRQIGDSLDQGSKAKRNTGSFPSGVQQSQSLLFTSRDNFPDGDNHTETGRITQRTLLDQTKHILSFQKSQRTATQHVTVNIDLDPHSVARQSQITVTGRHPVDGHTKYPSYVSHIDSLPQVGIGQKEINQYDTSSPTRRQLPTIPIIHRGDSTATIVVGDNSPRLNSNKKPKQQESHDVPVITRQDLESYRISPAKLNSDKKPKPSELHNQKSSSGGKLPRGGNLDYQGNDDTTLKNRPSTDLPTKFFREKFEELEMSIKEMQRHHSKNIHKSNGEINPGKQDPNLHYLRDSQEDQSPIHDDWASWDVENITRQNEKQHQDRQHLDYRKSDYRYTSKDEPDIYERDYNRFNREITPKRISEKKVSSDEYRQDEYHRKRPSSKKSHKSPVSEQPAPPKEHDDEGNNARNRKLGQGQGYNDLRYNEAIAMEAKRKALDEDKRRQSQMRNQSAGGKASSERRQPVDSEIVYVMKNKSKDQSFGERDHADQNKRTPASVTKNAEDKVEARHEYPASLLELNEKQKIQTKHRDQHLARVDSSQKVEHIPRAQQALVSNNQSLPRESGDFGNEASNRQQDASRADKNVGSGRIDLGNVEDTSSKERIKAKSDSPNIVRSAKQSREKSVGPDISNENNEVNSHRSTEDKKLKNNTHSKGQGEKDLYLDIDLDDIEEEFVGNEIYVCYLVTDEGAAVGPFKLDIEDIKIGLPNSNKGKPEDQGPENKQEREEGMRNRQTGSHGLNEFSSRSHSMLMLTVDSEQQDPDDENLYITKRGKLTFVDLAGSEKVKDSNSTAETLVESNNINRSLLVLGNCISSLGDPKRRHGHIPYRDSKLTKLLADSLGGNGVTLMVCCITPSSHHASETMNTLRYASRAKKIQTKPVVKMDPREKLILSLKREIKVLKNENHYLRQQLDFPAKPKGQLARQNDENYVKLMQEKEKQNGAKDDMGLYEMLQEYMVENEALRSDNADLQNLRETHKRDQQALYRDNERLLKRVEDLERILKQPSWQNMPRQQGPYPEHYQAYVGDPTQNMRPAPGSGGRTVQSVPNNRLPPPQDLSLKDPVYPGSPPQGYMSPTGRGKPSPQQPRSGQQPMKPPHRLSEPIARQSPHELVNGHPGGHPSGPFQQGPPSPFKQDSANRLDSRRSSQSSSTDAIRDMNEKLKQELAHLDGEIYQHQALNSRQRQVYGSQGSIR